MKTMSEKDTIQSLLEMNKKASAIVAVVETLGKEIDELKKELELKTLRIEVLEGELKKVKGGRNEW